MQFIHLSWLAGAFICSSRPFGKMAKLWSNGPSEESADVVPASEGVEERAWIGSMAGSTKIRGDIVSPVIDIHEIEAFQK